MALNETERAAASMLKGLCFSSFFFNQEGMMHPWCDLIYLTDIMADFDCDVFFPKFDRQLFKKQDKYDS